MFPTIKRRQGIPVVIGSITDDTSKEVLLVLNRTTEKPTHTWTGGVGVSPIQEICAAEGIFVAPEGGACLPALKQLIERGELSRDERVVLFNTGSGLKYLDTFS